MKWTISFLHNDTSYEDVTVDEANLAAVFARMTEREYDRDTGTVVCSIG